MVCLCSTMSKCSTMRIKHFSCCHTSSRWLRRWESDTTLPSWFLTSMIDSSDETRSIANRSVALRKRRKGWDIHNVVKDVHLQRRSKWSFISVYTSAIAYFHEYLFLTNSIVSGSRCRRGGVWWRQQRNQWAGQLCCYKTLPTLRQAGVQATGPGLHPERTQTRQKGSEVQANVTKHSRNSLQNFTAGYHKTHKHKIRISECAIEVDWFGFSKANIIIIIIRTTTTMVCCRKKMIAN